MKKQLSFLLAFLLCLSLGGCALPGDLSALLPPSSRNDAPKKMVEYVDISIHPRDPEFDRRYISQEKLTGLLLLLREIPTPEEPEDEPDLNDGQSYYTITTTYAGGSQRRYYLLGHRYMKSGDDPWHCVSAEGAAAFVNFLHNNPSDDGVFIIPDVAHPDANTQPHTQDSME